MSYQYRREPLTQDKANRLANACDTHEEKIVTWTLLDIGLRVSELASLKKPTLTGKLTDRWSMAKMARMAVKPRGVLFPSPHEYSHSLRVTFP
jgi:hypothetical protein